MKRALVLSLIEAPQIYRLEIWRLPPYPLIICGAVVSDKRSILYIRNADR
jgi:hypothetical protein